MMGGRRRAGESVTVDETPTYFLCGIGERVAAGEGVR